MKWIKFSKKLHFKIQIKNVRKKWKMHMIACVYVCVWVSVLRIDEKSNGTQNHPCSVHLHSSLTILFEMMMMMMPIKIGKCIQFFCFGAEIIHLTNRIEMIYDFEPNFRLRLVKFPMLQISFHKERVKRIEYNCIHIYIRRYFYV